MNDPIAIFPNETYLNGLRDADASVVDALYNEFRQPVARAIESAGGSYADGNTFFRVALIQSARMAHLGNYPADVPIYLFLKTLAIAQYRDWLDEKGQILPVFPETSEEENGVMEVLPDQSELRDIRKQIRAKRQFAKLSVEDQRQILSLANRISENNQEGQNLEAGQNATAIEHYKILLNERSEPWEQALPAWVVTPLTDTHFHQTWSACEALERRLYSSQVPASSENKTIRYAFIGFVLLTLGYAAYTWFNRDRTPAEVYDNNFQPPASILDDMAARYSKDSVAPVRPEICTIAFSQADAHYKRREWSEAASALAEMMEDSLSSCQSDALFYLAIVGLQMDRPELSIECISKIEDLDRFGEDIYWYMALAYVKMAANDPGEKDIARRAVERALSNTEIPERRVQAEKNARRTHQMTDKIAKYFPDLTDAQKARFDQLEPLYREWNEKINVVSRQDIENLAERHVLHSLAIAKVIQFKPGSEVLDLGTGGGFPGIPLAILFPDSKFVLVDGTGKKIRVVQEVSDALGLDNVTAIHGRAEEIKMNGQFDFVLSRGVASLDKLLIWSQKFLKKKHVHVLPNGILALKGGDITSEIRELPGKGKEYTEVFPIRNFFREAFFDEKWVVYVQG